jgi:hypothetical protein
MKSRVCAPLPIVLAVVEILRTDTASESLSADGCASLKGLNRALNSLKKVLLYSIKIIFVEGVADPDPFVFGHPGSGYVCFLASWIWIRIPIHKYEVRIWIQLRILLSSSKNSKKNLDCCCFATPLRLFIFEK